MARIGTHLERHPRRNRLHVGNISHPVVGEGGVDQAAHAVAHAYGASAQVLFHCGAHLHQGAASFVAQRAHGVGYAPSGPRQAERPGVCRGRRGPRPGAAQ